MATPHVAGAAALAFAKSSGARVLGVKDAILNGVDKKASLNGLVATGGRLNLVGMLTRLACCHVRPIGATPLRVPLVPAFNHARRRTVSTVRPTCRAGLTRTGHAPHPFKGRRSAYRGHAGRNAQRAGRQLDRIAENGNGGRQPGHTSRRSGRPHYSQHDRRTRQDCGASGLLRAAPGTRLESHHGPPQRPVGERGRDAWKHDSFSSPCRAHRPPIPASGRHARSRRP